MYNFGIPNTTLQTMLTATGVIFHDLFTGTQNVCVVWAGTNDIGTGRTPAQAATDLWSYCDLVAGLGYQVVVLTMLSRVDVSNVSRASFNALIDAGWAGHADALADVAASPLIGGNSAYLDTTYYDADGVHLNSTGYGVVAGIVETAVNSLA
jgi:lysophospholipase L1-like esterase